MLDPKQKIIVHWNNANKQHYMALGYTFTKIKDSFEVFVSDLPKSSDLAVEVICDYCNQPYSTTFKNYNITSKRGKDSCSKCRGKKAKETMIAKYGVEHYSQTDECKQRVKQTCQEKYSTDSVSQVEGIKQKKRDTNLEKFGSEWFVTSEQFKNQCLDNFGVDNPMKNVNVQKKATETLIKNGNVPISKEEQKLVNILVSIYGEDHCIPCYQVGRFTMDCLLIVEDIKIDVEYDGIYWHQSRHHYDAWRDQKMFANGYKVLRIESKGKMPTFEQIIAAVDKLKTKQENLVKLNIE